VTEPADPPAKPLRTWRPMILWTALILAALVLCWLGAEYWKLRRTSRVVKAYNRSYATKQVLELGGPAQAIARLQLYIKLPTRLAPDKDKSWYIRSLAADTLGWIGPAAHEALPALSEAMKDENEVVRNAAAEALKKIRAEQPPK
jgi:hypothetical protein